MSSSNNTHPKLLITPEAQSARHTIIMQTECICRWRLVPCQVEGDQARQRGCEGADPIICDGRAAAQVHMGQRGTGAAEAEQYSVVDHRAPVQGEAA